MRPHLRSNDIVQNLKDSLFPENYVPPPARSNEVKEATRNEAWFSRSAWRSSHVLQALTKLLENLPAVLVTMVGQGQAKEGVKKLFEALQNTHTNKHLAYIILEALLYKLFPEIPQRDLVAAFVHCRYMSTFPHSHRCS
jgi:sorting nexin-25